MGRYRAIECRIWTDSRFKVLSNDAKLIYFHVKTGTFSTPFGLFRAGISWLSDEIGWSFRRYSKAFQECLAADFWKFDPQSHVIFIPDFLVENGPASPKVLGSWRSPLDEIPACPLKDEFMLTLEKLFQNEENYGEAFRIAFRDVFVRRLSKPFAKATAIQEQYQEQKQECFSPFSKTKTLSFPEREQLRRDKERKEDVLKV